MNLFSRVIGAIALMMAGQALAIQINVTRDAVDQVTNGNCSLIEAFVAAQTKAPIDACPAGTGDDVLVLPSNSTYTFVAPYDSSSNDAAFPSVASVVTIVGNGSTLIRDGTAPSFRFFVISDGGRLTLDGLSLRNGLGSDPGGAILLGSGSASLTLFHALLIDNHCVEPCHGGAVWAGASSGLQIYSYGSAIVGNSATYVGALGLAGGAAVLVNTTVAGNTAADDGALASALNSTLTLIHSSVIANTATGSGALAAGILSWSPVNLENSVISGSAGGPDCWVDPSQGGSVTTYGYNLASTGNCPSELTGDPMLQVALTDSGLPLAYAPSPGSPLIDSADSTICQQTALNGQQQDQLGTLRPQDGNGGGVAACDVGAIEYARPATAAPPAGGALGILQLIGLLAAGTLRGSTRR